MSDHLFSMEDYPEIPLLREPKRKDAAVGVTRDARFKNDYPLEWSRCLKCGGGGFAFGELTEEPIPAGETVLAVWRVGNGELTAIRNRPVVAGVDAGDYLGFRRRDQVCPDCLGMGSLKAKARLLTGHRCERCKHPYVPKGDAKMLTAAAAVPEHIGKTLLGAGLSYYLGVKVKPSWREGGWSACDDQCLHGGPVRLPEFGEPSATSKAYEAVGLPVPAARGWQPIVRDGDREGLMDEFMAAGLFDNGLATWETLVKLGVEAAWRILTVHHLDGDKANVRWWNLAALCQRCHLEIQAKVVMERIYPHEHSEWFKPHAAGYYAAVYLGEDVTREEALERMDELLALEAA